MLRIHGCGGTWAFCDGKCEDCPYETETTDRTEKTAEPTYGVYVPIRDLMEAEKRTETIDLLEEVAKAAAKEQDEAIAGEICQVLARYGIRTEPGDILKRLEELDDRSNKRYRDGYLAGYRKALEDQERSEEGNG